MDLTPGVRENYIKIIDEILSGSDLSLISEKKIRKGIQDSVQYDITPQKAAIKDLILQRFDIFHARLDESASATETAAASGPEVVNGHHQPVKVERVHDRTESTPVKMESFRDMTQAIAVKTEPKPSPSTKRSADSDDMSELADASPPKKRKPSLDADAVYAARLQAEEHKRVRATRGGASAKNGATKKKKTPKKKKTARKVRASEDSDGSDSEAAEKKPVRNTGFHKPLNVSPSLSAFLGGDTTISRPQATKRIWEHIKENDLQDPTDKRQILCDDAMRAVFKQDKVHMFQMIKILNQHLYPVDD